MWRFLFTLAAWVMAGEEPRPAPGVTYQHSGPWPDPYSDERLNARLRELSVMLREGRDCDPEVGDTGCTVTWVRIDQWLDEKCRRSRPPVA